MTPAASAKNLEELAKYRVLAFQKGITTTVRLHILYVFYFITLFFLINLLQHWPHEFYPSWLSREKLPGVGAAVVKLTDEQKTLITGKTFAAWDVYDESLVDGVNLDNLRY